MQRPEIFGGSEAKQGVRRGPRGVNKAQRAGDGWVRAAVGVLPSQRYPLWFKNLGHDSEPGGKPLGEMDKKRDTVL